jgi:hypothetical protein
VAATSRATGEWSLALTPTPWTFQVAVGGTVYSQDLPEEAYLIGAEIGATITVPAGSHLFVQIEGLAPEFTPLDIPIAAGARTFSSLVTEIDAALAVHGGSCQAFYGGTRRLFLTAGPADWLVVIGGGTSGTSVHGLLGLSLLPSKSVGNFSADDLKTLLETEIGPSTLAVSDRDLVLTAPDTISDLLFGGVAPGLGFTDADPTSYSLGLSEAGSAVLADSLGLAVGDRVQVGVFDAIIATIEDSVLGFDVSVPGQPNLLLTTTSFVIPIVQSLLRAVTPYKQSFDGDALALQSTLSPLMGSPTLAQINDARGVVTDITNRLQDLYDVLYAFSSPDRTTADYTACRNILKSLEERGLDRALDLLQESKFSSFFALTSENSSRSGRLLKATEVAGRSWLSSETNEENIKDSPSITTSRDDDILPNFGTSDDG